MLRLPHIFAGFSELENDNGNGELGYALIRSDLSRAGTCFRPAMLPRQVAGPWSSDDDERAVRHAKLGTPDGGEAMRLGRGVSLLAAISNVQLQPSWRTQKDPIRGGVLLMRAIAHVTEPQEMAANPEAGDVHDVRIYGLRHAQNRSDPDRSRPGSWCGGPVSPSRSPWLLSCP